MSILSIKDLSYSNLFNNLNLEVNNNEFISLSGPNNCGKTTLFRILDRQINGNFNILINDKDINEYRIEELGRLVQVVIPEEIHFYERTLDEELSFYTNGNNKRIDYITKGLRIKRLLDKDITSYTKQEIVLAQLSIALSTLPKILLIDNISPYFNCKDMEIILQFLKEYVKENNITIIYSTLNLNESLVTDRLVIINDGKIELDGYPKDVLQKDNIINKIGLNIPFMIDLSVKLKDYDLLDDIEMDKNRMVDKLWN